MMLFRKVLVMLVALVAFCGPSSAEELTPDKRADIESLLTMTGALSLGKQMATALAANLTQTLKTERPDIPQQVLDSLPAEVSAVFEENLASFKEEIISIYHKHLTAADVKRLIQFYSTDLGQKVVSVLPTIMLEAAIVGQRWGQSLGPMLEQRILATLEKQGIKM